MANRRRQVVSITLPEAVVDGLRAQAQRNFRAVSREAELAIVRHLSEQGSEAAA